MNILVTGGAGYIGSHCCVALMNAGYRVIILDNFGNSHPEVLRRIEKLTGRAPTNESGDVRDRSFVEYVLEHHKCDAVIHFAGLKSVAESEKNRIFIMIAMWLEVCVCCKR